MCRTCRAPRRWLPGCSPLAACSWVFGRRPCSTWWRAVSAWSLGASESEMNAPSDLPLHERLAHWVAHLEHVLPAQAPIRNFVHHNTLHGLQHLPFPEALAEAQRISGARPWLDESRCRALLAAGRITLADLAASLDEMRL